MDLLQLSPSIEFRILNAIIIAITRCFFVAAMDPIVLEVSEQRPENNEEALINRDNDVCDPEFTIAPIS